MISSAVKGDRPRGSLEVNVSEGRSEPVRFAKEASKSTGRSSGERIAPKSKPVRSELDGRNGACRALDSRAKASVRGDALGVYSRGTPGVAEGDMSRKNSSQSSDPLAGGHRAPVMAKALRISRSAAKSWCAGEWGGWGQSSVDGPGQHNPDRSEDPWGRANALEGWCSSDHSFSTQRGTANRVNANTKGDGKPWSVKGMLGVSLTGSRHGKAALERPALKPYRGKPAVRNFRGGSGNVGIIEARSAPLPYPTAVEAALAR